MDHGTPPFFPAFIIHRDDFWELTTIEAMGTLSLDASECRGLTPWGQKFLATIDLDPKTCATQPVGEEHERLRRQSPLQLIRRLRDHCQAQGRHLFCALTFEAAHIFDDLDPPDSIFATFLVAQAHQRDKTQRNELARALTKQWQSQNQGVECSFALTKDTSPQFAAMFGRAKEHFRVGDIFEIVLSRSFGFHATHNDPYLNLARAVLDLQAPYRFALPFPHTRLVGASPELLVHVDGPLVTNRPISGSMRRQSGTTSGSALSVDDLSEEEKEQFRILLASEKEKSELDMLVDLARHDLHRICDNVTVTRYREPVVLETVVHTQATVTGNLRSGHDALDAVFSCLNAGTLVGAPKKKAMEILAQLEGAPRHFYGGNLIHALPDGRLFSTILIRTFQIQGQDVVLQAGATVLDESRCDYEFWECGAKAQGLLNLVGYGHLAFDGGVPPPIDSRSSPETAAFTHLSSFQQAADALGSRLQKEHSLPGAGLRLLLVDNHDSFTFNLAALFESLGCEVVVVRNDQTLPPSCAFDGVVLSPGPSAPKDAGALLPLTKAFWSCLPLFGVCLGFQAMVEARGGTLGVMDKPLHGKARTIRRTGRCRFLDGLPQQFVVARYHSLYGQAMPAELRVTAVDDAGRPMAFAAGDDEPPHCGVQFHPESFMSGSAGVLIAANWLDAVRQHKALLEHQNHGTDVTKATETLVNSIVTEPPNQTFLATSLDAVSAPVLAQTVLQLRKGARQPVDLSHMASVINNAGHPVFDVCGTGGTRAQRLNTSTLTALMAAATGMKVIKHGGRSASGHKGSVDLLEHLGLDPQHLFDHAAEGFRQTGLAFLGAALTYAPFGRYAAARKAFGKPTIFNLLGPLLNPVVPSFRLLGCFDRKRLVLLADTLALLREDGAVVLAEDSEGVIDEVNPYGTTTFALVLGGRIRFGELAPLQAIPVTRHHVFQNGLEVASHLINGDGHTPATSLTAARDFVFANLAVLRAASAALSLVGTRSDDFLQQVRESYQDLSNRSELLLGGARRLLEELKGLSSCDPRSPFANLMAPVSPTTPHRIHAVAPCSEPYPCLSTRAAALHVAGTKRLVLAEIKVRSPIQNFAEVSLTDQIQAYELGGAQAISVVTHPQFGGSIELLASVRAATSLPLLAKDFIRTATEAKHLVDAGADAVLVLEDWLGSQASFELAHALLCLGVLPVVESTNTFPGIGLPKGFPHLPLLNTRNLFTLKLSNDARQCLASQHPAAVLASDVASPIEAAFALRQNKGVLIGEALMKGGPQRAQDFLGAIEPLARQQRHGRFVKACGARSLSDIICALDEGVDLVGINLIPRSRRYVDPGQLARLLDDAQQFAAREHHIADHLVFLTDASTPTEMVDVLAREGAWLPSTFLEQPYALPLLSLARTAKVVSRPRRLAPLFGAASTGPIPLAMPFSALGLVLDGPQPGSGMAGPYPNCPPVLRHVPALVAGGITPETSQVRLAEAQSKGWNVVGVDVASSIAASDGVGFNRERLRRLVAGLMGP
jgi:anthranilate phosphoribosyltransferase